MSDVQLRLERARELLQTVHHAAMATVNEDGSPHNTPFFFACDDNLEHIYWSSHPDSEHSKNVARTGQIFVVLYDAFQRGGSFIRANEAHIATADELDAALSAFNKRRAAMGKETISSADHFRGANPQRLYVANTQKFWTNASEKDDNGLVIRDNRYEITRGDLLA